MRLLAALLVLVPGFVLSQTPEPASPAAAAPAEAAAPAASKPPVVLAPPPDSPAWAIGAGIVFDRLIIVDSFGPIFLGAGPEVTASVERQLSSRDWLALGVVGSVYRLRQGAGGPEEDYARLAAQGGIRRLLTGGAAPVEVSLLALAKVGGTFNRTDPGPGSPTTRNASWGGGAELGLVVERKLGGGLAVRVATPLAGVSWDWLLTDRPGSKAARGDALSVNVALAPRLELWLAF